LARQVEKGIVDDLATLEARSSEYARLFQLAQTLTNDIEQNRREILHIRDRLAFLQVESGAPGFVRIVSDALPAEQPYGPGRKKLLILLLLAAGGAGLLTPLVIDLLDRRVHTLSVAQAAMGMPAAGWQVDRTNVASELYSYEQDRRLASTLMRFKARQGNGVIGFSGVEPGTGNTTSLLRVAQTLQQVGLNVLTVEASGFRPSPRFKGASLGLIDVLSGAATADQIVAPADAEGPASVSFRGMETADAQSVGNEYGVTHLDRLKSSLAHWANQYDFVLVDMPPLFAAADAELLLTCIQQIVVVLEAGATKRRELARARQLLQTIDPQAVGFILNRVRPFEGSGYLRKDIMEFLTRSKHGDVTQMQPWKRLFGSLRVLWLRLVTSR
jgi:succinoglycan biosynthesis transport protein ExoP